MRLLLLVICFILLTISIDLFSKEPECKVLPKDRYSLGFSKLVCELKLSKQNPKLKAIVLAQWILESGRGKSPLASNHKNFGGLTWRKEMKKYGEPIPGRKYRYIKFKSIAAFVEGYWHFIDRYPYTGWDKYVNNPHEFIKHIHKSGYTPTKNYNNMVIRLEKEAKRLLK
jgi:flagellum-specific peptidoglycan hydrolase FlgJ